MTIRNLCPQAILIFLTASSREEWINRLLERRSETLEEVELRLQVAAKEYELIDQFDYLVVNSDKHLEQTIADIQAIIRAEHLKTCPRKVEL
jgi:guanylate kinase